MQNLFFSYFPFTLIQKSMKILQFVLEINTVLQSEVHNQKSKWKLLEPSMPNFFKTKD